MVSPKTVIEFLRDRGLLEDDALCEPCTGGDSHQSFRIEGFGAQAKKYFVKVNQTEHAASLLSEFQALNQFNKLLPGAYPRALFNDSAQTHTYLVMTYHEFSSEGDLSWAQLGELLAEQHSIRHHQFGWEINNHIGLSIQHNTWADNWPNFFWQNRLSPQLSWAVDRGLPSEEKCAIAALEFEIKNYFHDYSPKPCLLHGDLWVGNAGYDIAADRALLFDPAPYFGDPETDLAMSELFGGFNPEFYRAYHRKMPKNRGFESRRGLYNLYHALNHFVLFGPSYLGLVQQQLSKLK